MALNSTKPSVFSENFWNRYIPRQLGKSLSVIADMLDASIESGLRA
jgi:hypothetical protein